MVRTTQSSNHFDAGSHHFTLRCFSRLQHDNTTPYEVWHEPQTFPTHHSIQTDCLPWGCNRDCLSFVWQQNAPRVKLKLILSEYAPHHGQKQKKPRYELAPFKTWNDLQSIFLASFVDSLPSKVADTDHVPPQLARFAYVGIIFRSTTQISRSWCNFPVQKVNFAKIIPNSAEVRCIAHALRGEV